MIYKGLGLITNTESPIVVVLRCVDLSFRCCYYTCAERVCTSIPQWLNGASVLPRGYPFPHQPAKQAVRNRRHHRLQNPGTGHPHCTSNSRNTRRREGGQRVCFYQSNPVEDDKLTVRIMCSVREAKPRPENQLLLTKGDNNYLDDVELYQGLDWLERKHIVGKVRGWVLQS